MTARANPAKRTRREFETSHDFFDCRDSEVLSHETVEEAIEEYLDGFMTRDCDVAKLIAEHTPLEVRGFDRKPLDHGFADQSAGWLLESALEQFEEEYGGGDYPLIEETDQAAVAAKEQIAAALRILHASVSVWQCEENAKREYSTEEVEAMMRENNPDWFEVAGLAPPQPPPPPECGHESPFGARCQERQGHRGFHRGYGRTPCW